MAGINEVSQSTASAAALYGGAGANEDLGKEAFLSLLTAQLKHQDPLNPMDNTEFVAQLSQFSSLEQLYNLNDTMDRNGDMTLSLHNTMMTNLIGKDVMTEGNLISWDGEEANAEISYVLDVPGSVSIQVMDSEGNVIHNEILESQETGEHRFSWNGSDNLGNKAAAGGYTVSVSRPGQDGEIKQVDTVLIGKITGVTFADGAPILFMGDYHVNPSDILAVYESSSQNQDRR